MKRYTLQTVKNGSPVAWQLQASSLSLAHQEAQEAASASKETDLLYCGQELIGTFEPKGVGHE